MVPQNGVPHDDSEKLNLIAPGVALKDSYVQNDSEEYDIDRDTSVSSGSQQTPISDVLSIIVNDDDEDTESDEDCPEPAAMYPKAHDNEEQEKSETTSTSGKRKRSEPVGDSKQTGTAEPEAVRDDDSGPPSAKRVDTTVGSLILHDVDNLAVLSRTPVGHLLANTHPDDLASDVNKIRAFTTEFTQSQQDKKTIRNLEEQRKSELQEHNHQIAVLKEHHRDELDEKTSSLMKDNQELKKENEELKKREEEQNALMVDQARESKRKIADKDKALNNLKRAMVELGSKSDAECLTL